MENKSANFELSAAEQIDALEVICRSLAAIIKKRTDCEADGGIDGFYDQLDRFDFAALRRQLSGESASLSSLSELKSVLSEKELNIVELKNSLADSVVENRNLMKQHQALQDRFNVLSTQLTQMQLHSKDISLKFSTVSNNLENREKELESANSELQELRARSYQLKNLCADYEDQLKKLEENLATSKSENLLLKQGNEKAISDLDHVASSNRQLRQSLEALQQRETELVKTIDALQREKNHAQTQLGRMLTGLNKMAVYQQPDESKSESSLLEPKTLVPYLPFCFPERLPAAISFRREIQTNQPVTLQRRTLPMPRSFAQYSRAEPSTIPVHIRMQAAKMRTALKKPFEMKFNETYHLQPRLALPHCVVQNNRYDDDFELHYSLPSSHHAIHTTGSRQVIMLISRKLKNNGIFTSSFDMFMNYLTREIVERNFNADDQFTISLKGMNTDTKELATMKITNIFLETLAFRHRFQLQSQRIKMADASFNYSFKRKNRLKSVLEMFGNTINSMVQKYDIVATPDHGKSEPEK